MRKRPAQHAQGLQDLSSQLLHCQLLSSQLQLPGRQQAQGRRDLSSQLHSCQLLPSQLQQPGQQAQGLQLQELGWC